jgi:hypothetical protein
MQTLLVMWHLWWLSPGCYLISILITSLLCIKPLSPLYRVNAGCTPLLLALHTSKSLFCWRLPLWQTPSLVGTINYALRKKSSLQVQSIHHAYGGLSLLTNNVASLPKLEQVANAVRSGLGQDSPVSASLPQSWFYFKIVDVPIFKLGLMDKIDSAFTCKVMLESLVGHLISLASSPHMTCNTHHSDTTTVWFNVVDS